MKVCIINGSPRKNGNTSIAISQVEKTLNEEGIETEIFKIKNKAIPGCTACMLCNNGKDCYIDDLVNEIGNRADEFDGLIFASPVYYAGPNGNLLSLLDRLFYAHGYKFANKLGASIVVARRGGASAAFDRLNKYFQMNHVHIVSSSYWNQVYGAEKGEAKEDKEGLKTIRDLGKNIAWLLKAIELADKNGIERPDYGQAVMTNFIR